MRKGMEGLQFQNTMSIWNFGSCRISKYFAKLQCSQSLCRCSDQPLATKTQNELFKINYFPKLFKDKFLQRASCREVWRPWGESMVGPLASGARRNLLRPRPPDLLKMHFRKFISCNRCKRSIFLGIIMQRLTNPVIKLNSLLYAPLRP